MSSGMNLLQSTYPQNLLYDLTAGTELLLPPTLSEDQMAGLRYALSKLDQQEHAVLLQLYQHKVGYQKAGQALCMTESDVRQIATAALEKLRCAAFWRYIQYGVAGYSQRKAAEEYDRGYRAGYLDGTQDAAMNIRGSGSPDDSLNLPLDQLQLSARIYHCLGIAGYRRVRDLVALQPHQIRRIYGLGAKGCREVAQALQTLGIQQTVWDTFLE